MKAQGGEALDVALGLLRAPSQRTTLRARPLPRGVGELLAIAAGSAEGARRAAARTGYTEAELVEGARFYVQQVLLAEDADAYRVLGAARGADHPTLRDHHRLLLRWLHPDRSDSRQWDSALATRVNQAWNQLRTRETRARYDAALDARAATPVAAATRHRPPTLRAEAPPPGRAAPIAVATLGMACLALVWLAIRREDRPDVRPAAPPPSRSAAATAASEPPSAAGLPAPLAALHERPPTAPEPVTTAVAETAVAMPGMGAPDWSSPGIVEQDAAPLVAVTQASIEPAPAPAPVAEPTPAVVTSPQSQPAPAPPPMPVAAATWVSTPSPTLAAATAAPPPPPEIQLASRTDIVPAESTLAAPAAITSPVIVAPDPDPTVDDDPLRLLREAESTVRAVTAYLAAHDGPTPAWQDAPTGHAAAGIRSQLHARNDPSQQPQLALQSPNWTLGSQTASVLGAYRLDDSRGPLESGVLHIELTRRDRQWQVASLRLEPMP